MNCILTFCIHIIRLENGLGMMMIHVYISIGYQKRLLVIGLVNFMIFI